jgi:teichuronic acid biosynthesis glycosyltransferase TuaC
MRVLVFTNMWPSADDPYGTFVAQQAEDLANIGATVSVLPFDARSDRKQYLLAARRLRARIREDRPDVVHAHYGLTGFAAVVASRVPVITTFHGSDAHIPWQRRVSRLAAARSTAVCVSAGVAAQLGRQDAHVIPMGVDTELFRPRSKSEARSALGLGNDERYVLFPAARGNRVKRYGLFSDTVARLDATPLEFSGFDRDAAALLLNAVDVVLMTSLHEGSPLTVREALACGTPVVSVPVGDVFDTIADLPACAVAAPDPDLLAAALRVSFETDAPADRLRARALETSRTAVAARLLALYEDVSRRG